MLILPDCMMPDGAEPCKGYQQLHEHAEQLQAKINQFDTCMCGSPMDSHDIGSGHSPVSMYDYALDQAEKQNESLSARIKEQEAEIERLRSKLLDIGADRQQAAMEKDDPIGEALRNARREREEREKNWLARGSYGDK